MNFRQFLEQSTAKQLKSWLVRGFRTADFRPFRIAPEPSPQIQLKNVFDACDTDMQEKLRDAVVLALGEWSRGAGCALLRELAYLAADFRPAEAVPVLGGILERSFLDGSPVDEDDVPYFVSVVSAVAGFAGLPAANGLLERMFFDERMDPRCSGIVARGLVAGMPGEFTRYLPRLFKDALRYPEHFTIELLFERLVLSITPAVFADKLHILGPDAIGDLVTLTETMRNPPIQLVWRHTGVHLLSYLGPRVEEYACGGKLSLGERATTALYAAMIRNMMVDPTGNIDYRAMVGSHAQAGQHDGQ